MYDQNFFARRTVIHTKKGNLEVFTDIHPNINSTKAYGPGPYYKIRICESNKNEKPDLWGWKDFQTKEYCLVFPLEEAVRMCFPYGTDIEEKRGKGKLLTFIIEDCEAIE